MATAADMVDQYTDGQVDLPTVLDDFRTRRWEPAPEATAAQAWGAEDPDPPHPDSFAAVSAKMHKLTPDEYQQMGAAYQQARARGH